MEIRTGSINFPPLRGSGPRTATSDVHFAREVAKAACGLVGYSIGFAGDDHHIGLLDVRLDSEVDGDLVRVTGTLGLRDWSGNWDDDYDGVLGFAVLADLVSATEPPPRADLEITGFELSQVTQFFRSFEHLDGANVRPDNSIRPIARKPMGVRVYVDYDSSAGLPAISSLSGELVVTTSIGSATFTLAPASAITPRPDAAIDRGDANQTLNFVIPEGWCQGQLVLTCRVFDATAPTPTSRVFQRTVRFIESAPLRCYLVGIHYTGQGLDLAAPTQADVMSTLSFVESTYPVPEIFATGYSAIDFDKDMKADIADGCGDGFGDLLDRLRDMRGDSGDVYFAALPSGIDSGSVGGCGGGGVAATFVGAGAAAAQEIGHAFDRDHAPCDDSTRCDDPGNQDDNYPHYNGYPSDSIGEYGYDPATNMVFDPASSFDFMGYSGGTMWISPYTYTGLMGTFPTSSGIAPSQSAHRYLRASHMPPSPNSQRSNDREWRRRKMPTVFLGLEIDRARRVTLRPSFSYEAPRLPRARSRTAFTVEFRDPDDAVLSCQELRSDCKHCRAGCWPKSIRDALPLPDGARKLVVLEEDSILHQQDIPNPPSVRVRCKLAAKGRIEIEWSADAEDEEGLWYLVQWLDDDGETWRGVAPRTQDQGISLPLRRFAHTGVLRFRVLATSGIATGVGECKLDPPPPPLPTVEIVSVGAWPTPDRPGARLATIAVVDQWGRTIPDPDIVWYDEGGAEIGRGRSLDLGSLEERIAAVRAVALNVGRGRVERSWLTRRTPAGGCSLHPHVGANAERGDEHD